MTIHSDRVLELNHDRFVRQWSPYGKPFFLKGRPFMKTFKKPLWTYTFVENSIEDISI
jgi:hypothetical protein